MIPLQREDFENVTVVKIQGDLDFENTVWLRGELYDLFKKDRLQIVLDLSDVEIISSYTVGVFVAFARDLREKSGDLKFLNLQTRVQRTFEATRIDHILDIYNDCDEAVKSFN